MQIYKKSSGSFLFLFIWWMKFAAAIDKNILGNDKSELDCIDGTKITGFVCLPKDYQREISPKAENQRIAYINSSIWLKNIREIDVVDKTMTLDISLSFYWIDNRIQKKFTKYNMEDIGKSGLIALPYEKLDYIWKPDLYIFDMKYFESYKVNTPVDSISILYNYYWDVSDYHREYTINNTVIQYILDARAKVYCFKLSFKRFPMEENTCTFVLGTALTRADFSWTKDNDEWRYHSVDQDELVNGYKITNISWINKSPRHVNENYSGMGKAIGFKVFVTRQLMSFVVQYYIPCVAIVFLTQISFIIPLSAIPGRVALLVTEFLTLTNIFIHQQVIPNVVFVGVKHILRLHTYTAKKCQTF